MRNRDRQANIRTKCEAVNRCRRSWRFILALSILLGSVGCAGHVSYSVGEVPRFPPGQQRAAMRVAMAIFEDRRPFVERTESSRFDSAHATSDFGDICTKLPQQIAGAMTAHFSKARLFARVTVVEDWFADDSPEALTLARVQGFDALLVGRISHYYACSWERTPEKIFRWLAVSESGLVLLPFWLAVELLNVNETMTNVELTDLKLTDTTTGAVLWSGSFSVHRNEKYRLRPSSLELASEALKGIVAQMAEQISLALP